MSLFYEFWSQFLNRSPMATDTNRAFVEYAVRDYTKPMGVARPAVMSFPTKTSSRNSYKLHENQAKLYLQTIVIPNRLVKSPPTERPPGLIGHQTIWNNV